MESAADWHSAKALLEWHIELGAYDAIGDAPIDRYALEAPAPKTPVKSKTDAALEMPKKAAPPPPAAPKIDYVALAKQAAAAAQDIDGLRAALKAFDGCELKRGARNLLLADGNPAARVMIIGEVPNRDEDMQGKPFVGRSGALFDKMFAAIGMGRDAPLSKDAVYVVPALPWRAPNSRAATAQELAMMVPFLERHIQLVAPEFIVVMGNTACQAVLGRAGLTRMRGEFTEAFGKPVLPMFHPDYLLRTPAAKRDAWHDLLTLQQKLNETA